MTVHPVFLSEKSEKPGEFEKYENQKHGLIVHNMDGSSLNFDSPTNFKSDTSGLVPKVIELNPNDKPEKAEKQPKPRLSGI